VRSYSLAQLEAWNMLNLVSPVALCKRAPNMLSPAPMPLPCFTITGAKIGTRTLVFLSFSLQLKLTNFQLISVASRCPRKRTLFRGSGQARWSNWAVY
jgi:hypothetical protein